MPRRWGHTKPEKPWDREKWSTRKRRHRIGTAIKQHHKDMRRNKEN